MCNVCGSQRFFEQPQYQYGVTPTYSYAPQTYVPQYYYPQARAPYYPETPARQPMHRNNLSQYVFAGDSISQGLAAQGYRGVGVRGVSIRNMAHQFASIPAGSRVVVAGGTNDAHGGFNPAQLAASVDRVMMAAAARGVRIEHWVGPVKPNPGGVSTTFAHNLVRTNEFLKRYLTERYGVGYVDLHAPENRVTMAGYHPTGTNGYSRVNQIIASAPSTTTLAMQRTQGDPRVAAAPAYAPQTYHQSPRYYAAPTARG